MQYNVKEVNGFWIARADHGGGKYEVKHFNTEQEALDWIDLREACSLERLLSHNKKENGAT